jgi:hypothetical protein
LALVVLNAGRSHLGQALALTFEAGSNSSTWVKRMLLPDGPRDDVSIP